MSDAVKIITPRGTALFPCLLRSEVYQGKETGYLTCKIVFEGEALETIKAQVSEFLEETYGPKKAKTAKSPFRETKDGKVYILFKAKSKTKDGEPRVVPFVDAKAKPVQRKVLLGSGSTIKISGSMLPKGDGEPGVSFWMNNIQIIRLVEYKPGNNDFTPEEEEGGFDGDEFDAETTNTSEPDAEPSAPKGKKPLNF